MAGPEAKRRKKKIVTEKVQNLPLLCVEAICKFTPSSKLVRVYSKTVPLPGASWNVGLESVLRKRLPLSLGDDLPAYHQADAPVAIYDRTGAKVACIKRPEAFDVSPLRALIERASVIVPVSALCQSVNSSRLMRMYITHCETLLPNLRHVVELTLLIPNIQLYPEFQSFIMQEFRAPNLKHLLPQLRSLRILVSDEDRHGVAKLVAALTDYVCEEIMPHANCLRRLVLPERILGAIVLRASATTNSTFRRTSRRVLSGLSSLGAWQNWLRYVEAPCSRPDLLRFLTLGCRDVSTLALLVQGEFKAYLAVFRALPCLATLGLYLKYEPSLNGITFNENEAVGSVLNLRLLVYSSYCSRSNVFAIASLFPNAKALAFQLSNECRDALDLAADFCRKQVLPVVEKLSCFYSGEFSACTGERLTEFIASSHLPEEVDFSTVIFSNLSRASGLLTDIYRAMQGNSTKTLRIRGPMHRQALSVLQSHVDLMGETVTLTAWKDRDLGEQPGLLNLTDVSRQTDFKIVGMKLSGCLKGEPFSIRLMHQLAKQHGIFDFEQA